MQRLERASVLLTLNEEMRKAGSWTGETHMQKAVFFLQELMHVSLELDFILYKHARSLLIYGMSSRSCGRKTSSGLPRSTRMVRP